MNTHQKIAFGTAAILAVAFLIVWGFSLDGLGTLLFLAVMVALLTLPLTWKLIYGTVQLLGATLGFVGHTIGKTGDWVDEKAWNQKLKLAAPSLTSRQEVPHWGSPSLATVGASSSDDHDVPSFLDDALDRQS